MMMHTFKKTISTTFKLAKDTHVLCIQIEILFVHSVHLLPRKLSALRESSQHKQFKMSQSYVLASQQIVDLFYISMSTKIQKLTSK